MTQISNARIALLVVAFASAVAVTSAFQAPSPRPQAVWYKGNLHTHTLNSDGDSTPDDVVRWYRERGYQFVLLTDHNYLTSVTGLNALHGADDKFLVLKGEEVTDRFGDKPIHVNGLEVERFVPPPGGRSVVDMVQRMVDAIRDARGVPSINHPNFGWAISPDELGQIQRTRLFEVFNGHPKVNNLGGGGVAGLEDTWDRILSSGKLLYGIAVDDAHYFKRPEDPAAPRPGKGWVYVRAPRLDPRAIVEALDRGEFYASTGVELRSLESTASGLSVAVREQPSSKYRIQFIGRQGRVLREATTPSASYTFTGDEGYVRAKIIESNGALAWVQPVPAGPSAPR
ncbi:MAG: hypothetical protein A3J29_17810 [Acidobacteria bacterium RIFCSPLOWO2_12_FULL_67_14b]|nr:MAG: hypothetical protein A3J29_17810 [Acidobacteria bacterium RIFCSPLOWO2_12_FULL_67_14b]